MTHITWRNGEPAVNIPPTITSAVAMEQAKAIWNAVFRVAFRFSREINIGKPAPNTAPGMRKISTSNTTLVQASSILPTKAARPGYHASSVRSIWIRFPSDGRYPLYLVQLYAVMAGLSDPGGEAASRQMRPDQHEVSP